MNPHEPLFWLVIITGLIAISFVMIAGAMIAMAVFVNRAVKSVNRLEEKLDPLINRANAISEQAQIASPTTINGNKTRQPSGSIGIFNRPP